MTDYRSLINSMGTSTATLEMLPLQEACRIYRGMRDLADELRELSSRLSKHVDEARREKLPEMFKEAGTTSITVDGYRFTISETIRASIASGLKPEAFEWLRGNDLEDIITETVNASTLSAQARTMMEEGLELDQDLFKVYIQPNVSVTKS